VIKLSVMLRSTPSAIIKRSKDCKARLRKTLTRKDETDKIYKEFKFIVKCRGSGEPKECIIRMYEGDKAWVHCSCSWFKYNAEVALSIRGSSDIISSSGKMPKKTNPTLKPWICKHLIACIPIVEKKK